MILCTTQFLLNLDGINLSDTFFADHINTTTCQLNIINHLRKYPAPQKLVLSTYWLFTNTKLQSFSNDCSLVFVVPFLPTWGFFLKKGNK